MKNLKDIKNIVTAILILIITFMLGAILYMVGINVQLTNIADKLDTQKIYIDCMWNSIVKIDVNSESTNRMVQDMYINRPPIPEDNRITCETCDGTGII
jgi:hypothetical protein